MMTTKKRRRFQQKLVVVAAVGTLLTACGPPGARQLEHGERDIKAGQFGDAIEELQDATHILGDAPATEQAKAWNLLGLAFQGNGQPDAASKAYLQALKLDRNNAAIDYNLGCLRSQQRDYPAAIDYLTTYVTLRGKDAQGYLRRGTAYFHYALEPANKEQRRLLKNAQDDFESAEKISPSAEAANELGMLKMHSRSSRTDAIHAAEADFVLAIKRDPRCAPALLNLAILYQQYLNNPRQALKLYQEYVTISPAPPHFREIAQIAHDLDLSLRISITPEAPSPRTPTHTPAPAPNPAPRPAPPSAEVKVAPANPVATMPRPPPEEAPPARTVVPTPVPAPVPAPVAATAPAPPPQTPPPSSPPPTAVQTPVLALPSAEVSNTVPQPVVTDTNHAPRKSIAERWNPLRWFSGKAKTRKEAAAPEPPPLLAGARYDYPPPVTPIPGDLAQAKRLTAEAVRAQQAGDFIQCIRAYKEAVAADPTFYDACYGLGLVAVEMKDYATALAELHRAVALDEDSAEARYAFAWTLQRQGYTEDAVHELGKLLSQHPADARGHLLLGSLYAEKLKQPKLAREHYMQALELDPTNAQAANVRAWLKSN